MRQREILRQLPKVVDHLAIVSGITIEPGQAPTKMFRGLTMAANNGFSPSADLGETEADRRRINNELGIHSLDAIRHYYPLNSVPVNREVVRDTRLLVSAVIFEAAQNPDALDRRQIGAMAQLIPVVRLRERRRARRALGQVLAEAAKPPILESVI